MEWENDKWKYSLDVRNYPERPRVRHRTRPNCKECVHQGLKGLAHNDAWCKGFCKMHAKQRGLKEPNHRTKPNCKECVQQGLKGLAHNDPWCKGFCKMHARQKGLKEPKNKKETKVKKESECKDKVCAHQARTEVEKEVKKKTKKRTGRVSENAAKEDLGEEGEAGCTIPKRLKRLTRFGCPLLNTQTHPPLELPEHEKDTEMQNEQEPRDAPKATRDN